MTGPASPDPRAVHADATVVDLHAHPSMKTWFGGAKFAKRVKHSSKGFDFTKLRTTYPSLADGGVNVLCSAIYVPEKHLTKDCWIIGVGGAVLSRLRDAFARDPFAVALDMMAKVEHDVAAIVPAAGQPPIRVVRSNAELDAALMSGAIAVIHTIEGAHVLGGNPTNVARLHQRGVALITLAHFYPNGVAPPVDGIPRDLWLRSLGCFGYKEDLAAGLPPTGRHVVEEMFRLGVIVDLTHTTPPARHDVYRIPNPRGRPLIMSHVGVGTPRGDPMNADRNDIRAIAATGGVVGIIFYNYWLAAKYRKSDTVRHVVEHVRELVNLGGEDVVAFGSDFDGMTDPPDDLREPAQWPNLTAALLADGFTPAQVEKFLGGNARRVLRDGWS